MKFPHSLWSKLLGRNTVHTPPKVISEQLTEPRPLPLGKAEFYEWADRIIAGAMIPGDPGVSSEIFMDSQRAALADMVMHLGPTESHKPDAHFIHYLRKVAVNQVCHAMKMEITAQVKKALSIRDGEPKLSLVEE